MSEHEIDALYALKYWLETFPEFCNYMSKNGEVIGDTNECKEYNSKWMDKYETSIGVLYVLEEILQSLSSSSTTKTSSTTCVTKNQRTFQKSYDEWKYMSTEYNFDNDESSSNSNRSSIDCKISLLSEILCHTMTNNCNKKEIYIHRILDMDDSSVQRTLMEIIENGLDKEKIQKQSEAKDEKSSSVDYKDDKDENDNNINENRDTAISANIQQQEQCQFSSSSTHSHQYNNDNNKKKRKLSYELFANELECSFTSDVSDTFISSPKRRRRRTSSEDKEEEENVNKIKKLEKELSEARVRESEIIEQLETLRSQYRGLQLNYETKLMERERQLTDQYKNDIEAVQSELEQNRATMSELEDTKYQLALLQDEVDCLKHCEMKLGEAEHRLQNLRDRLEDMGDLKSALLKEEESHGNAVNDILRLENELNALQPLRRQLESYKTRATDAEVKLIEYQEELSKVNEEFDMMKGVNQELKKLAMCRQDTANSMKQIMMLRQEDLLANDGTHGIGEGITELNPDLQEEILRLRNENGRLKEFADKRSEDSVEMLEGNLDDSQRLSEKLKSEFLSTKARLEVTLDLLKQSNVREEVLQNYVKGLKEEVSNLEKKLKDESEKRMEDNEAAKKELQTTKETLLHQHQTELENTINSWNSKLEQGIENTKKRIKQSEEEKAAMSKQWFETLADEQANYEDRLENAAIEYEQMEQTWTITVEKERQISDQKLQKTVDEYHHLNLKWEEDMKKEKEHSNETMEQLKDMHQENESRWKHAMDEERKDNEMKLEEAGIKYQGLDETKRMDIELLQKEFHNTLEQHQSQSQQELERTGLDYTAQIKTVQIKAKYDREEIIKNGTKMLKQEQKKIENLTNEFNEFKQIYKKNEENATAKVSSLKKKLTTELNKNNDLDAQNLSLEEEKNKYQREKLKLQEENDRFRRLMANGHSDDTATQSDMNKLSKEYDLILKENKKLKNEKAERERRSNDSNSLFYSNNLQQSHDNQFLVHHQSDDHNSEHHQRYFNNTTKASTLSHLRDEYDQKFQKLTEEKRELLRHRMTAETELSTLRKRYNNIEDELSSTMNVLTSTKLELERYEVLGDNNNNSWPSSSKKQSKSSISSSTRMTNHSKSLSNNNRTSLYPATIAVNNNNETKPSPLGDVITKTSITSNNNNNKENIEFYTKRGNNTSFSKSKKVSSANNHVKLSSKENNHAVIMRGSANENNNTSQRNNHNRKQPNLVDLTKTNGGSQEPSECTQS